jgi:hypothetical protein
MNFSPDLSSSPWFLPSPPLKVKVFPDLSKSYSDGPNNNTHPDSPLIACDIRGAVVEENTSF